MLIAIDHGNYAIKTPHHSFVSGLSEHTVKPPMADEILEYDGRYWTTSGKRLSYMKNGKPDLQFCRSLETGIITMNNEIIRKVGALHDMRIEDEHISAVLSGQDTILPDDVKQTICGATKLHAQDILNQLRELQVDLRSNPAVFIGGGSLLLRPFLEASPLVAKADFVESPNANALGYEMLGRVQLSHRPA